MASKLLKDEDLTDSTDWQKTSLERLERVDSALRCSVCKEFFRTPMITSCSHTFCSICIRRCLSSNGLCPTCRTPDQEMKLKVNTAIQELVEAFVQARPQVLEIARRTVDTVSPKRKREVEHQIVEQSPLKRRTRASGRAIQPAEITVIEDSDDGEYMEEDEEPKDELVACPICQDRMTIAAVGIHIDKGCDGIPRSKKRNLPVPSTSTQKSISSPATAISKPIQKLEKMSKPHYDMLKDVALRKKLSEQGLSAGGSRQAMEKRFTEWCLLWNSECDSKNPKSKSELKKELDIWERTQGDKASTLSVAYTTGVQIKDKEFDGNAWANTHKNSFDDLVAKARAKVAAKKQATTADGEEAGSDPPPPTDAVMGREFSNNPLQSPLGSARGATTGLMKPPSQSPQLPDLVPPDNLPPLASPIKYSPRFFQDADIDSSMPPPSSQYQGLSQGTEKDSSINSDMSTYRPLQP